MEGHEIIQALSRFEYGDTFWKFYIDNRCERVKIEWSQPDSRKPGETFMLRTHVDVEPWMSAEDLHFALTCEILALRDHEVREGIRVDGKILLDPHKKSWADGPDGYATRRTEIINHEQARNVRRAEFRPDGTSSNNI